jgi:beta-1,2-mannobiose phosphorylase / 1,2-beta-oligomannan phosphorylase
MRPATRRASSGWASHWHPLLPEERSGTIANVVFPTGIDRRDDLGAQDRFDVYYGMADQRIGVARLDMPEFLPSGSIADPPDAKV